MADDTAKKATPLPDYDTQEQVVLKELELWTKIADEMATLLPPNNAKLGSPEMSNAPSGKLQAAIATFLTVFGRKTGRPTSPKASTGKKATVDKTNPAQMLDADRKALVKAARDFIAAARDCGVQIEAMGGEVGLAEVRSLSDEDRAVIAKTVRDLKAKKKAA